MYFCLPFSDRPLIKGDYSKNLENSSSNFASDADSARILRANLPPDNDLRPVSSVLHPRPLWLSTTGYFLTSLAASLSLFFVTLGLLHDETQSETPWIPAGIVALLMMSLAISAREVVLRRAQTRYLLLYDKSVSSIVPRTRVKSKNKFTLEQNAAALRLIQNKVDEANSVLATAENHFDVFKASQEYLELVESELQKVQAGSPRLSAFRNGQESIRILHKHHLLRWAAEKAQRLMREADVLVLADKKNEMAHRALEALDFALKFYPDEPQLIDSSIAIREFMVLSRVTHWIELAARAAFKKQYRRAVDYYQDALFYLSRKSVNSVKEHDAMTARIRDGIERLNLLSSEKTARRKPSQKNSFREES